VPASSFVSISFLGSSVFWSSFWEFSSVMMSWNGCSN